MNKFTKATLFFTSCSLIAGFFSCTSNQEPKSTKTVKTTFVRDSLQTYVHNRLDLYEPVKLTTNLNALSVNQREVLPLLIQAAQIMDDLFWQQAYPKRDSLLASIKDEDTKNFLKINYGPWDRLNNNKPFIAGVGERPAGATFYPAGMSKSDLETADLADKFNPYTIITRDTADKLSIIPYHILFAAELQRASSLLKQAALKTEDLAFKKYLNLRADALESDNYAPSDNAWLDMKSNTLDIIIGPIEVYEDKLFNARTSFEAYVLVKDKDWSKRLEKYVKLLPALQKGLPVAAKYKKEKPGIGSDLNAYDVVYYAGDCNAGSKTIAVNLPNNELIQQKRGSRRAQFKNTMKAKFDKILLPIAKELIDTEQQQFVGFDAFFTNVMFHEVAHGLGIKKTVNGKGFVKDALKDQYSWLEEGKADVLGLYMVTNMIKKAELTGDIKTYYTTFMASLLRSVRFGASEAHGYANMQCFNYFMEKGAFARTADGKYKIDYVKFESAVNSLGNLILTLQGNGNRAAVENIQKQYAFMKPELQLDLDRLTKKKIPIDIVFEQGADILGVK